MCSALRSEAGARSHVWEQRGRKKKKKRKCAITVTTDNERREWHKMSEVSYWHRFALNQKFKIIWNSIKIFCLQREMFKTMIPVSVTQFRSYETSRVFRLLLIL
jgi:hypothetical protein